MKFLIALLSGIFAYLLAGMGLGGGVVLIPTLTFFTEIGIEEARFVCLASYIPASVGAVISAKKNGTLNIKKVLPFIPLGCAGAVAGSLLSGIFSGEILNKTYGILLTVFGLIMLKKSFKNGKKEK